MPRQNRVTPYGELIDVPDRGMFWGNRGRLHNRKGNLVRYSSGQAWAICVLEFKGRRRPLWAPGKLTELFFLDEATTLAAGQRPCGAKVIGLQDTAATALRELYQRLDVAVLDVPLGYETAQRVERIVGQVAAAGLILPG